MTDYIHTAINFLRSIGLDVKEVDTIQEKTFCHGVLIRPGGIDVLRSHEISVGDLIHEGAHVALIPSVFWDNLEANIEGDRLYHAFDDYLRSHEFIRSDETEDPIMRGLLQAGDAEATAWTYAAMVHLGIPIALMIQPRNGIQPYDTKEEAEDTIAALAACQYIGINGLQAAGFCNRRSFPTMKKWLSCPV